MFGRDEKRHARRAGRPAGRTDDETDRWTEELRSFMLEHAGLYLSRPLYEGRVWLRAVFQNPYTGIEAIDRLFACVGEFARRSERTARRAVG